VKSESKGGSMPIKGEDTIQGLVGEPPRRITLPFSLVFNEEKLRPEWNHKFIAIMPYCFNCKVPLMWHSPPTGEVLFECPKCGRKWVKSKVWAKDADEAIRALKGGKQ